MNHQQKFNNTINLTITFIEEMLLTGADIYAIEELLFGNPMPPGRLQYKPFLPTAFDVWKNHIFR